MPLTDSPLSLLPRRAPRVIRARLLTAVADRANASMLTVLRAPAGFGKTTLMRHWSDIRPDVVWLTAHQDRSAGGRGWSGIITDALAATGEEGTVFLDDVDAITAGTPEELLGLLRARPHLRLILAGRGGSWLPDDLLADIGATVIGAGELAFTREETAELLAEALPYLDSRGSYWTDQVYRSAGGWPEITAAVARRMAVAARDPIELSAIATRTATEFLRRRLVPELERLGGVDLALTTAVADRFTAELADAVTGRGGTAVGLDGLVAGGLLVAETVGGQTLYRWPDAARAVLVEELTFRDPDRFAALHTAWARHLMAHGQPRDAVRHAVSARNWPLLVTIVDTAWRSLLHDDGRVIKEALTAAPVEALAGSAHALALREILLFTPGSPPGFLPIQQAPPLPSLPASVASLSRLSTAAGLTEMLDSGLLVIAAHRHQGRQAAALQDARRLLEVVNTAHATRPADVARHRPSIHLAVGVGHLLTGDVPAAMAALELALRHGATTSGTAGSFAASGAASLLAMSHAVLGDVTTARRWLDRLNTIEVAWTGSDRSMTHLHVASAVAEALIAVDELDADAAEAAKRRLALLDPASPWLDLWAFACYAQAQYALHRGDVDAALDQIARARAIHGHDLGDDGIAAPLLAAAEGNLLIAAGRGNQAHRHLRATPAHWLLQAPTARLALLSGDAGQAARLASDKAWECAAGTRDRVEMRLIRAVAARRAGDGPLAESVLDRAVRAAREAGLRSVWATVPRVELDGIGHRGAIPAQLLRAPAAAWVEDVYPDSIVVVELTERERDVLDRLAAGATLERIAETLVISYNTVKTHVANIYRKLRVDSRDAAVAEARRFGLLDESAR